MPTMQRADSTTFQKYAYAFASGTLMVTERSISLGNLAIVGPFLPCGLPEILESPLVDLEHRRDRHLRQNRKPVGALEASELFAHPLAQLRQARRLLSGARNDEGPADLAEHAVGDADDC